MEHAWVETRAFDATRELERDDNYESLSLFMPSIFNLEKSLDPSWTRDVLSAQFYKFQINILSDYCNCRVKVCLSWFLLRCTRYQYKHDTKMQSWNILMNDKFNLIIKYKNKYIYIYIYIYIYKRNINRI